MTATAHRITRNTTGSYTVRTGTTRLGLVKKDSDGWWNAEQLRDDAPADRRYPLGIFRTRTEAITEVLNARRYG